MMKRISVISMLSLLLCAVSAIAGEGGIKVKDIEAYPTFECIGLRLHYEGDTDSNAVAAVRYRMKGRDAWREAQPLGRIMGSRFAGSIFFLNPGARYEVEVTVTDPGGAKGGRRTLAVTTRSDRFPTGGGREYYVGPEGDDNNKGSMDKPLRTIRKAAGMAGPGDIVMVMPGVYCEEVSITRPGRKNAYVAFKALGKGVILSGAAPYENPQEAPRWRLEEQGVYSTEPGFKTSYIAADGKRLFHYLTRDEFEEFICGEPGGWYCDKAEGRLYVRLSPEDNPDKHLMQLAELTTGFHIREADYVLIEGFEIRDYGGRADGAGIHLDRAAWCVVRNCSIHGMQTQVLLSGARAEGNLVENCELWDSSIPDWPWEMTKSRDTEGGGVLSTGGRGNVVRGCRMHDIFDGLAPSHWDSLWVESYNCDWDVYDNEIYRTRDDVVEPEGPCINFRFWNNWCHDIFTGVSLAPINVGPAYVMYNVIYDENWQSLKYGQFRSELMGRGICYLYHNTIYVRKPDVHTVVVSRPLAGQVFRNNIVCATNYPFWTSKTPLPTNDIDYNTWYSSDTEWFEIWTGKPHKKFFRFPDNEFYFLKDLQDKMGWELHGIQADPCFMAPESGDLRLGAGSPCVDSGLRLPNINDHYTGDAPDMGAYERGSPFSGPFPLGR